MRSLAEMLVALALAAIILAMGAFLAWLLDVQSTNCQSECVPVMAEDIGKGVICIDRAEEVKP